MGATTRKGEIGEAMVLADLRRRGHGVAIPFGHDLPFDLILIRQRTGALERVQCKYTESDGRVVRVSCRSSSDWVEYRYTADMVDWIAAYDATTDRCYYVPSPAFDGMVEMRLRLVATSNGQGKRIRWASDYQTLTPPPPRRRTRALPGTPLPFLPPPE